MIQSILLCVCFKMKTDNIEIQILELVKERLLNEHDEKQERKENLDIKALKYESSEDKKHRENKVFKLCNFDKPHRRWMIHHKHTQKDFLGWVPTCM